MHLQSRIKSLKHLHLIFCFNELSIKSDRIGDVIVSLLASSAVDRGFEPRSGQTKDYKIGMCCQLYYGENKLIFNEMMMNSTLY
jgi:hypothetical protein